MKRISLKSGFSGGKELILTDEGKLIINDDTTQNPDGERIVLSTEEVIELKKLLN